jgi:redox-sensing transcriptional repressor
MSNQNKLLSAPSIRRMPSYLTIIRQAKVEGVQYISGTVIAQELNVEPIQVRKDLSITGIVGKPKKGYPTEELIASIESFLGWNTVRNAVLIGSGNLGSALLGYGDFRLHGLNVVAAFDSDATRIGADIHGVMVHHIDSLKVKLKSMDVSLAILTVPSHAAQKTADLLVDCGIEAIWNFTNTKLKVPDRVMVQREDLSSGYALLCVMIKKNSASPA